MVLWPFGSAGFVVVDDVFCTDNIFDVDGNEDLNSDDEDGASRVKIIEFNVLCDVLFCGCRIESTSFAGWYFNRLAWWSSSRLISKIFDWYL